MLVLVLVVIPPSRRLGLRDPPFYRIGPAVVGLATLDIALYLRFNVDLSEI